MKTFLELRKELDEVNFNQDHKKNHVGSAKIKNTEIHYHSERKGSKKIRVFVKPKSAKEYEELGVFKDMNTANAIEHYKMGDLTTEEACGVYP